MCGPGRSEGGPRCRCPGACPGFGTGSTPMPRGGPGLGRSEEGAELSCRHRRMRSTGGWKNAVKVVMRIGLRRGVLPAQGVLFVVEGEEPKVPNVWGARSDGCRPGGSWAPTGTARAVHVAMPVTAPAQEQKTEASGYSGTLAHRPRIRFVRFSDDPRMVQTRCDRFSTSWTATSIVGLAKE